jgi:hypothetical protein
MFDFGFIDPSRSLRAIAKQSLHMQVEDVYRRPKRVEVASYLAKTRWEWGRFPLIEAGRAIRDNSSALIVALPGFPLLSLTRARGNAVLYQLPAIKSCTV